MHTFILKNTVKEKEHFRNFVKIKYDIIMRRMIKIFRSIRDFTRGDNTGIGPVRITPLKTSTAKPKTTIEVDHDDDHEDDHDNDHDDDHDNDNDNDNYEDEIDDHDEDDEANFNDEDQNQDHKKKDKSYDDEEDEEARRHRRKIRRQKRKKKLEKENKRKIQRDLGTIISNKSHLLRFITYES